MKKTTLKGELSKRPPIEEVKESGILKTTTESKGEELEKAKKVDELKKKVGRRPSMQEVVEKGIVKKGEGETVSAPAPAPAPAAADVPPTPPAKKKDGCVVM